MLRRGVWRHTAWLPAPCWAGEEARWRSVAGRSEASTRGRDLPRCAGTRRFGTLPTRSSFDYSQQKKTKDSEPADAQRVVSRLGRGESRILVPSTGLCSPFMCGGGGRQYHQLVRSHPALSVDRRPRCGVRRKSVSQAARCYASPPSSNPVDVVSGLGGDDDEPGGGGGRHPHKEPSLSRKMLEAAATAFASIAVLAAGFSIAGYVYHKSYKYLVLKKMTTAFEPGDPVLELAAVGKGISRHARQTAEDAGSAEATHWVQRPEQETVDRIVAGKEMGHYHLLIGEKGTGKSSMLLEAMRKIDGEGVAMFEAHADLEIFRIRLGKALDFEFHEDYIGSYWSERGPRDSTALLDIERALNKLEKVALRRRARVGRPLVLIVNQMHLVRNDEDGKDLIELLQQRAEQWAAANLVTMVFNSDDYWVYERLKQLATRMEVLSVQDLPKAQATAALQRYRHRYFGENLTDGAAEAVYDRVGGRLTFLNRVARSRDMLATCESIVDIEKTWFLNQCWILGADMDDDVMDQQKWASAAMVLAQALVDKEAEMDRTYDPQLGHVLPWFPLHKAQEVMTRADFIRELDRLHLFTITSKAQVRASSVPMHRAFREICAEPGFRDFLDATLQRIADIESLGRTRELVAKDLVLGGRYQIQRAGETTTTTTTTGGKRGGGTLWGSSNGGGSNGSNRTEVWLKPAAAPEPPTERE